MSETMETANAHFRDSFSRDRYYFLVFEKSTSRMVELPASGAHVIGRHASAFVILDDPSISRQHARVELAGGTATLTDLGSQNGTFVNGERLTAPRALAPGDVIGISKTSLVYHASRRQSLPRPVLNAEALAQRATAELEQAIKHGRPFTIAIAHVRESGDPKQVAEALVNEVGTPDLVGWSADGAPTIAFSDTGPDGASMAASRLIATLGPQGDAVSIGIAGFPNDGSDYQTLVNAAAQAAAQAPPRGHGVAGRTAQRLLLGTRTILVAEPAMSRLYALVKKLAQSDLPILITGETGTGKEHTAYALHAWSPRAKKAFVTLNCAAIQESLVESELFGHERGAFSGAVSAKVGMFESGAGGTIFLDEIGELSPAIQAKLLRVLETKRVTRVGDVKEREIDIRVVAATNRDLEEEVRRGRFRRDLYFRLSAALVWIPPLRERPRELPVLAEALLDEATTRLGRPRMRITERAHAVLTQHSFPGNVRELKNLMDYLAAAHNGQEELDDLVVGERLALRPSPQPVVVHPGGAPIDDGPLDEGPNAYAGRTAAVAVAPAPVPVRPSAAPTGSGVPAVREASQVGTGPVADPAPTGSKVMPAAAEAPPITFRPIADEIAELEKLRMTQALAASGGNQTHAAELIQMPLRTFVHKLKEYGLHSPAPRRRRAAPSADGGPAKTDDEPTALEAVENLRDPADAD